MTFFVQHRSGAMKREPPLSSLSDLLGELDERPEDIEHGSVALTHESEWCLAVELNGAVIFENLEGHDPKHMIGISRDKIIELWTLLAHGQIETVAAEPWIPGYP